MRVNVIPNCRHAERVASSFNDTSRNLKNPPSLQSNASLVRDLPHAFHGQPCLETRQALGASSSTKQSGEMKEAGSRRVKRFTTTIQHFFQSISGSMPEFGFRVATTQP